MYEKTFEKWSKKEVKMEDKSSKNRYEIWVRKKKHVWRSPGIGWTLSGTREELQINKITVGNLRR